MPVAHGDTCVQRKQGLARYLGATQHVPQQERIGGQDNETVSQGTMAGHSTSDWASVVKGKKATYEMEQAALVHWEQRAPGPGEMQGPLRWPMSP